MEGSQRCPSVNTLGVACTEQTKAIGFASILTIGKDAAPKGKKRHGKVKGKKRARVATVSVEVGVQQYIPEKLPSSKDAHLNAMVVGFETANAILPSSLCAGPMLPLVAILAIFRATLDSPYVVLKDKA